LVEVNKFKKHNAVLKKALLQEQERTKSLELSLREKDDKIRASIDNLSFNNTRLTKRIQAMQNELEEKLQKSSSGWFGGGKKLLAQKDEEIQVLQSELHNKLQENAVLHNKAFEMKKEHDQAMELVQSRLTTLKTTLQEKQNELDSISQRVAEERQSIEAENKRLQATVDDLNKSLASIKEQMEEREKSMTQFNNQLNAELQKLNLFVKNKVSFDDTSNPTLNCYNIPPFEKNKKTQLVVFYQQGLSTLEQLIKLFDTHNNSLVEKLSVVNRTTTISESLRNVNKKIISLLPSHNQMLQALFDSLAANLSKFKDNQATKFIPEASVLNAFQQYVDFRKHLLGCHLLRLEEENKQTNASNAMQTRNTLISESEFHLQELIEQLLEIVKRFYTHLNNDNQTYLEMTSDMFIEIMSQFHTCVAEILAVFTALLTQLSSKVNLENQDPYTLPILKEINERLVESHSQITAAIGKFASDLLEYTEAAGKFSTSVRGAISTAGAANVPLSVLQSNSMDYMALINARINGVEESSLDYAQVLKNQVQVQLFEKEKHELLNTLSQLQALVSSLKDENKKLKTDLISSEEKINVKQAQFNSLTSDLVQTRQKLEAMTSAYERLHQQRASQPEPIPQMSHGSVGITPQPSQQTTPVGSPSNKPANNLIMFDDDIIPGPNATNPAPTPTPSLVIQDNTPLIILDDLNFEVAPTKSETTSSDVKKYKLTVFDEFAKQMDNLHMSTEDKEREEALVKFYDAKLDQLLAQVRATDDQSLKIHSLYQQSLRRLKYVEEQKTSLEQKVQQFQQDLARAKEDLELTRKTYEEQMNVFTEHITQQNERLAQQSDQITALQNMIPKPRGKK